MAYSLVASGKAVSADTNAVTTAGINTTGADLLVVLTGAFYGNGDPGSPTDSNGNTWTGLTAIHTGAGGPQDGRLWYAKNATVGSGHTFSWGITASYPCIFVLAFSGSNTSAPFEAESGTSYASGASAATPGSLTPAADNELMVAGIIYPQADASDTGAVDSSFVSPMQQHAASAGATNCGGGITYQIQTTATLRNPSTSAGTGSPRTAAVMAVFKVAGAGGGGGVLPPSTLTLTGVQ